MTNLRSFYFFFKFQWNEQSNTKQMHRCCGGNIANDGWIKQSNRLFGLHDVVQQWTILWNYEINHSSNEEVSNEISWVKEETSRKRKWLLAADTSMRLWTRFDSNKWRVEMRRCPMKWQVVINEWPMNEPTEDDFNENRWMVYNSKNGTADINATDRIDLSRFHVGKSNWRSGWVSPLPFFETP